MDVQIPLIFIGVFVVACISLFFVYKFGIKEKSYEEALAEQRQQTQALLGIKPTKPKEKKKKLKKAEKLKDKPESELVDNSETPEIEVKKAHVEFKSIEEVSEVPIVKKKTKTKVKPILLNKDDELLNKIHLDQVDTPPTVVNHFEELHPKDEIELFKLNQQDELLKQVPKKSEIDSSPKKQTVIDSPKKSNKKSDEKIVNQKKVEEKSIRKLENVQENGKEEKTFQNGLPINNGLIITNSGKEKKKKKSEFNTLQQLTGDGQNISILLDLVRNAELSRNEVQILIDLLLNKQHETPANLDEWSEGKSDPVQKLKKQLAEKEKLLIEEQEALHGVQAKLREIRAEQLTERSQLQSKVRNYEELLQSKQIEFNRVHTQLQQQLNDEIMKQHKLHEELNGMQLQRQQYEIRLVQQQETDVVISQLRQEIVDNNGHIQQLRLELQRLSEEKVNEQERNQTFLLQLNTFKNEIEQKNERLRQLEDEKRVEIERIVEKQLRQENDFKLEISHLKTIYQQQCEEIRRMELGKKQYQDELFLVQKQKEEYEKIISQLKEKLQSNGSLEDSKAHKVEILNLHNELSSMRSELQQTQIKYRQDLELNHNKIGKLENELKEQKVKNNELREKNWKVMEALLLAESRTKMNNTSKFDLEDIKADLIKTEQESQRQFIQRLFPDIKELSNLNSDEFHTESEKLIKNYIGNLQPSTTDNKDAKELENQIKHYKNVIDNTEKTLSNLQKHIEEEEINWRMQLAAKTSELEAIKEHYSCQLQTKLSSIEKELKKEQDDKNRIIREFQELNSKTSNTDTRIIEKLTGENNCLTDHLQNERVKNGENCISSKAQNCTSNGSPLIEGTGN